MHHRPTRSLAVLSSVLAAGPAFAGTLTDGNASFQIQGPPVFATTSGDATLITDPGMMDQLFKYCWYYRTPFNGQNRLFSSLDSPSESFSGNTAVIRYLNAGPGPAGQERFDAEFTIRLEDGAGPGEVVVFTTLRFRNASTSALTFQVFNLVDEDLSGTPTDDTAQITDAAGVRARFTESSANYGEHLGIGAARYEVATGSSLRTKLTSFGGNLANSAGPVTGDVASAFQWSLTLAPGEETTVKSAFSLRKEIITRCPADLNGDGQVDFADYLEFLNLYDAGDPAVDFNQDGQVDFADYLEFLNLYDAGC